MNNHLYGCLPLICFYSGMYTTLKIVVLPIQMVNKFIKDCDWDAVKQPTSRL